MSPPFRLCLCMPTTWSVFYFHIHNTTLPYLGHCFDNVLLQVPLRHILLSGFSRRCINYVAFAVSHGDIWFGSRDKGFDVNDRFVGLT